MTSVPTLNGQVIGQAERAARAVLDVLLERTRTSFHQWVVLNRVALSGGTLSQEQLTRDMTHGLKVTPDVVEAAAGGVVEAGFAERRPDGSLTLTPAGDAKFREIRDGIAEISARLYGDIPAEDLAVAQRVLTTVTARANEELARVHGTRENA